MMKTKWYGPYHAVSFHLAPLVHLATSTIPNSFADIFDQDSYGDEDDEEQMVKALSEIATVKVGPKVSQKQRCKNKPIDHRTISSIAKKVRSGHFNLPDLKLNNHKG